MRVHRHRVAGALAVVLVAGAGTWAPSPVSAAQCGSALQAGGRWSAVDVAPSPSLPVEGSTSIVSTSAVGQDPSVVLATDGVAVYRSTDGGCTWRTTYTLGPADYWNGSGLASAYMISNIVNGHSAAPAAHQVVYLALSPNPLNAFTMVTLFGAAPPELMMVSRDGGQTFAPVQPAPSAAHPIVPECLSAPTAVLVPPTSAQEIYLYCPSGLAQGEVDRLAAGGEAAYRSLDGGQSWSLFTLPSSGQYGGHWFLAGVKSKELWSVGQRSDPTGNNDYLAVWHTVDDGAHWTMSKPSSKPGVGIGIVGIALDPVATPSGERLVAYAPIGAFVTTDSGKSWAPLRGTDPASGMKVAQAFFVRHTPYVISTPTTGCKPGATLSRYDKPRARPVNAVFPARWGTYLDWGGDGSFAAVSGGAAVFGVARFCATSDGGRPPKMLSFRAH